MKSRFSIGLVLGLLVAGLHLLLFLSPLEKRLEPFLLDVWFSLRGSVAPPPEVILVAMDEQSYSILDLDIQQPWPRSKHGELLKRLSAYGAKRVIFDILFLGESTNVEADQFLVEGISSLPTVLGAESALRQVSGAGGSFVIEELNQPPPAFVSAAENIALVGLPDDFGIIRRFNTTRTEQTQGLHTLSSAASGKPLTEISHPGERDFINYYGPARSIQTYSYYQVLESERPLPADLFKDKIVFVGLVLRTDAGPAQKDIFRSPFFGSHIFGSEIHATAAANILEHTWIRRGALMIELLFLSALALVLASTIILSSPVRGGLVLLGAIVLWLLSSYIAFLNLLFIPGLMLMLLVLPLTYLLSTIYDYSIAQRAKVKIQSAFEHYLSPEMARQMAANPESLKLGGEKIWATAVFTDIAGFTSITESMPPEKVAAMLNAYFTEVLEVVFENQGTLIKFIGDAAFILFGAPLKLENHAELAVRTALQINTEVAKFNASARFPNLITRIGVHTGPMLVGNLGSQRRFDYTAIGDSVNLASRVEGLNKYFGTTVLFTEPTFKELSDTKTALALGAVQVVGKREMIELFTVFETPLSTEIVKAWADARRSFEERAWEAALQTFKEIGEHEPLLKEAALLYEQQITQYLVTAPSRLWRGELVFSSK
jgi:adenylate cyclase